MIFNLIFAHDLNNGIGLNGKIPWYIKEDLQHFNRITNSGNNNVVIMGRKTWESIPHNNRPLKNRLNLILSNTVDIVADNTKTFKEIGTMIEYLESLDSSIYKFFVIGGESIYKYFLNNCKVSKIYVTKIYSDFNCKNKLRYRLWTKRP